MGKSLVIENSRAPKNTPLHPVWKVSVPAGPQGAVGAGGQHAGPGTRWGRHSLFIREARGWELQNWGLFWAILSTSCLSWGCCLVSRYQVSCWSSDLCVGRGLWRWFPSPVMPYLCKSRFLKVVLEEKVLGLYSMGNWLPGCSCWFVWIFSSHYTFANQEALGVLKCFWTGRDTILSCINNLTQQHPVKKARFMFILYSWTMCRAHSRSWPERNIGLNMRCDLSSLETWWYGHILRQRSVGLRLIKYPCSWAALYWEKSKHTQGLSRFWPVSTFPSPPSLCMSELKDEKP